MFFNNRYNLGNIEVVISHMSDFVNNKSYIESMKVMYFTVFQLLENLSISIEW